MFQLIRRFLGGTAQPRSTSPERPRTRKPAGQVIPSGPWPPDTVFLRGDGSYDYDIHGESRYRDALARLTGGRTAAGANHRCDAFLVLEHDNPHDPNAIRVEIAGETVGYIPRKDAPQFRKQMGALGATGHPVLCRAKIMYGWYRGPGDAGGLQRQAEPR